MKSLKLFLSLFGIALFSACSENEIPIENERDSGKDGQFLAVEIVSPSSNMSRAMTAPGDGDFEEGLSTPDENQVNSLRFYFFDAVGNPISVSSTKQNYLDVPATDIKVEESPNDKDLPNVEQKLKAVLVVRPEDKANVASMLAVANFDKSGLSNDKSYSRTELAALSGDYSAVKDEENKSNFMMTSSTYANASGQVTRVTLDPSKHLCATAEDALKNPVAVYIERVVAKVRVEADWKKSETEGITMEEKEVTYNSTTYKAIKAKDKEGKAIQNNGKDVYILFTGWNVTGKADKSYLIKKVNSTTAWSTLNGLWFWNHPNYHRSYWAVNPGDVKLKYDTYTSINQEIGKSSVYCLENAADGEQGFSDGMKASYNPAKEKSNRTQVILAAVLVTVDDSNQAQPISLAQWGYQEYTEETVKAAMFALLEQRIYVKEESEDQITYRTIKLEEVELVTAKEAGKDVLNAENDERYLSYLKLTKNAESHQFYADQAGKESLTKEEVNKILCSMPGAKIWHNGLTYYYTDIRHLGQDLNNAGYGYYGVVRNHIYDIKLKSVTGLGTPVLNPNENIIPQHPLDDKDIYIAAQVNILSWRIVNNNVDLEW